MEVIAMEKLSLRDLPWVVIACVMVLIAGMWRRN